LSAGFGGNGPAFIFAQALGLLDIEGRLGLAKFFESPIDSFERIVEIT